MKKVLILATLVCCISMITVKSYAQCGLFTGGDTWDIDNHTDILTSGVYNNYLYWAKSDITIDGDVTFTDAVIIVSPDVSINIKPGSHLSIFGCHIFSCDAEMWNGIKIGVTPGSHSNCGGLTISNSSSNLSTLIEDAKTAISVDFSVAGEIINQTGYPTNMANIIEVENTIFNKNYDDIDINRFEFNYTYQYNNPQVAAYRFPFDFKNSVFTCRNIAIDVSNPYQWVSVATLKESNYWNSNTAIFPNLPNTLIQPYITNSNYPATTLKSPYAGKKSNMGIILHQPDNDYTTGHYEIGNLNQNAGNFDWNTLVFDNHTIGIKCYNYAVEINNVVFQSMNADGSEVYEGIGILSQLARENSSFFFHLKGRNGFPKPAFFDCKYAVKVEQVQDVIVSGCDIRSRGSMNNIRGENGIVVEIWRSQTVDISDNNIYNINNAITYRAVQLGLPITNTNGWFITGNEITIGNNKIGGDFNMFTQPITSYNTETAINVEVAIPTTANGLQQICYNANNVVVPCNNGDIALRIINNTISNYISGIHVAGIKNKDLRILNNTINLMLAGSGFNSTNTNRSNFGIKVEDHFPLNINNGNNTNINNLTTGSFIYGNTITGATIGCNCDQVLIDVFGGNNYNINCNHLKTSLYGLRINGDVTPNTNVYNNTFDNSNVTSNTLMQNGLALVNNGTIGQQGSNNAASDNLWEGDWGPCNTSQLRSIVTDNSDPALSTLFVRQNMLHYDPSCYTFSIQSAIPSYSFTYGLFNGSASNYPCTVLSFKTSNTNKTAYINSQSYIANNINFAEGLIKKTTTNTQQYNKQWQFWQSLHHTNSNMLQRSSTLKRFFSNPPKAFTTLAAIEEQVERGENAQNLLNSWQPTNIAEENYKQYYTMLGNKQPNVATLLQLARQCPLTGGSAVFYARAWYNSLTHQNIIFNNNCRAANIVQKIDEDIKPSVAFYPNPAQDFITINNIGYKQVELFNSLGKLIKTIAVGSNSDIRINLSSFSNGLYFIKAITKSNEQITNKLIINK